MDKYYTELFHLCLFCICSHHLSTAALSCSSLFIVKPGEEDTVYAPSGHNATFSCTANGSDLSWEFNGFNLEIPRMADELVENGIFFTPPLSTGQLLSSNLTVLVSDYSHEADICCQGRAHGRNRFESCCTMLIEFGRPLQPFLEVPHYLREAGSFNLSWTPNITQGVEYNYTIIIHNVTSTSHNIMNVTTSSLHYILDKCGEFNIQVIAVNRAGESDPSNTVRVCLPLLPDITPVSQSLEHRLWKVNGTLMLLITLEPANFCAEHNISQYCVELDSPLTFCIHGNETEIVITSEHGLEENRHYGYRVIAQNGIGNSTSAARYSSTSDVEKVELTRVTDYSCQVECHFINGSDARGCKVVIVSNHTIVDNITATLLRGDQTESIATTTLILNHTRVFDCYHHVFAYDIETNNSTSNFAITGTLKTRNITTATECVFATTGETQLPVIIAVSLSVLLVLVVISLSTVAALLVMRRKSTHAESPKHESKAAPSGNTTITLTATGRYSPATERDDKEPSMSDTQAARLKENQDTVLEEPSTYATVGSAEASSMEINDAYNAGPIYAFPEKLKPKSVQNTFKLAITESATKETHEDPYNKLNSTEEHVYHVLESGKDTKAASPVPLESRKSHSSKSGTDLFPGAVYQDIQDLPTKAKKVTESSTSQTVPSDHDPKTKVSTGPMDDVKDEDSGDKDHQPITPNNVTDN